MKYNEKLKVERQKRGITQSRIANDLGITQQQYYLYESGKRQLPIELLIKICNLYKISADELLEINTKLSAIQNDCNDCKESNAG